MKKAFIVLVSLFIRLGFGFIAPSAVSKRTSNDNSSTSNHREFVNILLEKPSKIGEKEIYQNTENKTNNVNQRSFIYINRNIRKMIPDQFLEKTNSGSTINRSILSERLPQGYIKSQRPVVRLASSQKQLFNPHFGQNKPAQLNSKLNQFIYPMSPKIQIKNTEKDVSHDKESNKIKELTPKANVTVKDIEDRHKQTYTNNFNQGNTVTKRNKINYRGNTRIADVNPSLFYNNIRYLSHSQKKPKLFNKCGFVKPNWLHHKTLINKHELATLKPGTNTNGFKTTHSLEENIDYDKLAKYLKQTLEEFGIDDAPKTLTGDHHTVQMKRKYENDDLNNINEQNSNSEQEYIEKEN